MAGAVDYAQWRDHRRRMLRSQLGIVGGSGTGPLRRRKSRTADEWRALERAVGTALVRREREARYPVVGRGRRRASHSDIVR